MHRANQQPIVELRTHRTQPAIVLGVVVLAFGVLLWLMIAQPWGAPRLDLFIWLFVLAIFTLMAALAAASIWALIERPVIVRLADGVLTLRGLFVCVHVPIDRVMAAHVMNTPWEPILVVETDTPDAVITPRGLLGTWQRIERAIQRRWTRTQADAFAGLGGVRFDRARLAFALAAGVGAAPPTPATPAL